MAGKTAFVFILATAVSGCASFRPGASRPEGFVTAIGNTLYDRASGGRPIVLRGVNAGGWLLTENWMCPNKVAKTQTETYESFAARFGAEKADELYDIYRANWWKEEDFADIASLGMNAIRLPLDWRSLIAEDGTPIEKGLRLVDWFVERAGAHGIYTILDLHGAPGSQNGRDHSGEVRFAKTFHEKRWLDLTCTLWKVLAARYRDETWVAGYDLVNEPEGQIGGKTSAPNVEAGLDALYRAVREVDGRHLVFIGACWDPVDLPPPSKYGWTNVAYEYHFYAWGQGDDPQGILDNLKMHRDREHATGHGVPVYVGEFTFFDERAWPPCLELMNAEGWSWTLWTWKNTNPKHNWGISRGRFHSDDTDALPGDGFETVKAKWSALGEPGAFRINEAVAGALRRACGQAVSPSAVSP
ncbi:MAG: cellulase family glycosylhydrolase [Kiritimatiellae bacterium]|nr:cellulase family glycosylhydrolase [Kiritimatiellia bacterium]